MQLRNDPTRRAFLQWMLCSSAGIAIGASAALGQDSRPAGKNGSASPWSDELLEKYVAYERQRLRRTERDLRDLKAKKIRVTPEYDRTLDTILLTLRDPKRAGFFEALASKLPAYTKIVVVGPRENGATRWGKTLRASLGREVTVVDATESAFVDVWAQDVLEPINVDGKQALLLPLYYRYLNQELSRSSPKQGRTNVDGLGAALQRKSHGRAYLSPVYFQGGDLAIARHDDEVTLLTSVNPILNTQRYYRQICEVEKSREEILRLLGDCFGVERVEVIAAEESRILTQHLDQNCCVLPNKKVLVTTIVPDDSSTRPLAPSTEIAFEERRCATIRANLEKLGFSPVQIEVTRAQLSAGQIAVNGIPFVHRDTGQRTFLLPTWSNMSAYETKLQARNVSRIRALGIQVVPVEEEFFRGGGNLHCAVNALR